MIVRQNLSDFSVEFFDTNGERSLNRFSPDMKSLETSYYNASNIKYMHLDFNYSTNKIISMGEVNKVYNLEPPIYDGNGALFLVFSKILPDAKSIFVFNLLQSKEKRIVKMYLKYVGKETIKMRGKDIEALKYETGLESRVLSFFWPYKYNYWFSVTSHDFLRYEGPYGHKDSEIIEVN